MLSYQHAYHAGNAADVHKHLALVMLLRRLRQKVKPFSFVDAHAGRGLYDLESAEARKTREAESGVLRLPSAAEAPEPIRDYLAMLSARNPQGAIRFYPGSAALAQAMLRDDDRAILLELHPQESAALRRFVTADSRFSLHVRDCYEALPALLPPPIRRGLVLIDPSYEMKAEYEDIVHLLGLALRRWSNGIYLLWYPLLPQARHLQLLRRIERLAPTKTLISEFSFAASAGGLRGSGLVIVNSPWQFENELTNAMQHVIAALGFGAHSVTGLRTSETMRDNGA